GTVAKEVAYSRTSLHSLARALTYSRTIPLPRSLARDPAQDIADDQRARHRGKRTSTDRRACSFVEPGACLRRLVRKLACPLCRLSCRGSRFVHGAMGGATQTIDLHGGLVGDYIDDFVYVLH